MGGACWSRYRSYSLRCVITSGLEIGSLSRMATELLVLLTTKLLTKELSCCWSSHVVKGKMPIVIDIMLLYVFCVCLNVEFESEKKGDTFLIPLKGENLTIGGELGEDHATRWSPAPRSPRPSSTAQVGLGLVGAGRYIFVGAELALSWAEISNHCNGHDDGLALEIWNRNEPRGVQTCTGLCHVQAKPKPKANQWHCIFNLKLKFTVVYRLQCRPIKRLIFRLYAFLCGAALVHFRQAWRNITKHTAWHSAVTRTIDDDGIVLCIHDCALFR